MSQHQVDADGGVESVRIHLAIFEEIKKECVPLGYIVRFDEPGAAVWRALANEPLTMDVGISGDWKYILSIHGGEIRIEHKTIRKIKFHAFELADPELFNKISKVFLDPKIYKQVFTTMALINSILILIFGGLYSLGADFQSEWYHALLLIAVEATCAFGFLIMYIKDFRACSYDIRKLELREDADA
jgi:hypothetical protein